MPDGYSEYWERYKAGAEPAERPTDWTRDIMGEQRGVWPHKYWGFTPEAERHGAYPGSMEDFLYRRSLIPGEIREMERGEAATALEMGGLLGELGDWGRLSETLTRPVDKIAKWLINYVEIPRLREKLRREQEQADISRLKRRAAEEEYEAEMAGYGEWGAPRGEPITGGAATRLAALRKKGVGTRREPEEAYPIPDWMKAYLEYSMAAGEKGKERGAFELRPLGAQAEPSLEELGEMKGYQTWTKAGAPLSFKEYAEATESMEDWWEEYQRLSESLFPARVGAKTPRWYPSRQTR